MTASSNRLDFGARVVEGGTRFRAYAKADRCSVRLFGSSGALHAEHPLEPRGGGIFEATVRGVGHGERYTFVVDGREVLDPWGRWFPEGVHRPPMVFASSYTFENGFGVYRPLEAQVIYELHVGTFTPEGTFAGAATKLGELAKLGVTTIELMPVTAFAGSRGWGYDTVAHFATHAAYGDPDELRAFVDAAHGHGLAVMLDVVYNHFGPSGNTLRSLDPELFGKEPASPWGEAPSFSHPVMRAHVLDSAHYFLHDVRIDGLRLDATHAIIDRSTQHILHELSIEVARLVPKKDLIAEDDRGEPALVTDLGMDGVWADDFHHEVHVTLTGERDGYYAKHHGGAAAIARTIEAGWTKGSAPARLPARAFIYTVQNHDQVGNRALGERLDVLSSPEAFAAAVTVLLFLPMTPLLFMGQEWAAPSPFLYFTDHEPELGRLVSEGRRKEFAGFARFASPEAAAKIPDPQALETFVRSRLDWSLREQGRHRAMLELHHELLRMRHLDPVLAEGSRDRIRARAFDTLLLVDRWNQHGNRVLAANLGHLPVGLPLDVGSDKIMLSTIADPDAGTLAPWEARILSP